MTKNNKKLVLKNVVVLLPVVLFVSILRIGTFAEEITTEETAITTTEETTAEEMTTSETSDDDTTTEDSTEDATETEITDEDSITLDETTAETDDSTEEDSTTESEVTTTVASTTTTTKTAASADSSEEETTTPKVASVTIPDSAVLVDAFGNTVSSDSVTVSVTNLSTSAVTALIQQLEAAGLSSDDIASAISEGFEVTLYSGETKVYIESGFVTVLLPITAGVDYDAEDNYVITAYTVDSDGYLVLSGTFSDTYYVKLIIQNTGSYLVTYEDSESSDNDSSIVDKVFRYFILAVVGVGCIGLIATFYECRMSIGKFVAKQIVKSRKKKKRKETQYSKNKKKEN